MESKHKVSETFSLVTGECSFLVLRELNVKSVSRLDGARCRFFRAVKERELGRCFDAALSNSAPALLGALTTVVR